MKNIFILITLFYLSFQQNQKFVLISNDIKNNEIIDKKFTPFGEDLIPSFSWKKAPKNTKSFAFTVEDPDAPVGNWYHLILINIDKSVNEIKQNTYIGKSIKNSWGNNKYKGPQPPSGTHHYHFIIYALDVEKIEAKNKNDFEKNIKNHIIDKAEIVGLFSKQNSNEL